MSAPFVGLAHYKSPATLSYPTAFSRVVEFYTFREHCNLDILNFAHSGLFRDNEDKQFCSNIVTSEIGLQGFFVPDLVDDITPSSLSMSCLLNVCAASMQRVCMQQQQQTGPSASKLNMDDDASSSCPIAAPHACTLTETGPQVATPVVDPCGSQAEEATVATNRGTRILYVLARASHVKASRRKCPEPSGSEGRRSNGVANMPLRPMAAALGVPHWSLGRDRARARARPDQKRIHNCRVLEPPESVGGHVSPSGLAKSECVAGKAKP